MKIDSISNGAFQSFYSTRKRLEENVNSSKKETRKNRQNNIFIAAAALAGAMLPIVAINAAKGRGKGCFQAFKKGTLKDKTKAAFDLLKIESCPDIAASAAGSIGLGTAAGSLTDKNPQNQKTKYKEGIFEFLNVTIPTIFVTAQEALYKSGNKKACAPARFAAIAGSVAGGMYTANKASNKINEKLFDDKDKRKFKPADCLVHIDDILGLFVIAKIPFVNKIHADKILMFLYAHCGFEAGSAKKQLSE